MSGNKTRIERPDELVDIVKKILKFNKNMLTPDQMFNRLTISLAQLKAGNNSEKIRNEI